MRSSLLPVVLLTLVLGSSSLPAHEQAVLFGRNTAGQLQARVEFDPPLPLAPSIFPGFSGFATGFMGMHSTSLDEPEADFFQLSPAADFRFVLVAKDPGMEVLNDTGSAFMNVGESFFLGAAPFDGHPLFVLRSDLPGTSKSLTLLLRDSNGIYTDSAPFVLSFSSPPKLSIALSTPGTFTITWGDFHGFVLEQATSLEPGAVWTEIPPPYGHSSGSHFVNVPVSGPSGYFRLRQEEERPTRRTLPTRRR